MKHFSNKQFLAAIVTLTLTGAAMAQDGSDQTVSDAKVIQSASEGPASSPDRRPASKPDGSDQRLSQDQRTQQIQGFPGQDGPIPSKPDGSDERHWDAKVAAQAREAADAQSSERGDGSDQRLTPDQRAAAEIQGYPSQDGPIPAKSDGSDQLLSDAERVRLEAETTDRGVQFELSGSGANGDEKCGVILISLTPDLQQHVSDFPKLLWDGAVLGFGDLAPTLSLAIPSDYLYPDQFYAQGVVINSNGSVQASEVHQIRSR